MTKTFYPALVTAGDMLEGEIGAHARWRGSPTVSTDRSLCLLTASTFLVFVCLAKPPLKRMWGFHGPVRGSGSLTTRELAAPDLRSYLSTVVTTLL